MIQLICFPYDKISLFCFQTRYDVKEVPVESKKVTKEMTACWEDIILPTILFRYQLSDVYNAYQYSLFYEALPSRTLHFKGQCYTGCKHGKAHITGMTASNALGEKIPILAVEKSAKPRWFKHVRNLPCQYRAQRKAQMDGTHFEE